METRCLLDLQPDLLRGIHYVGHLIEFEFRSTLTHDHLLVGLGLLLIRDQLIKELSNAFKQEYRLDLVLWGLRNHVVGITHGDLH